MFDTSDVKSSFAEDIQAIAVHGEDLYLSASGQGVLLVPKDGRARLLAFRYEPDDLDGLPEGDPQRIADFHPGRLVAAPDGTVYVLSKDRVYRYDGEQFAPIQTPPLDDPQDIAVDRQSRLYIADTGNGRVLRGQETLIGASAPAHCANRGLDEPDSLEPTRCHAIEALAVDSEGNRFVATDDLPPRDPRRDVAAEQSAPLLGAEIFPPRAPRAPNWQTRLDRFAIGACAISYRWTTRFVD